MTITKHSKCKECGKIRNVSELKDNPSGIGVVCVDSKSCKKQQSKNQWRFNHEKKIKISLVFSLVILSSTTFASVLMSQWTEGTSRFCKYSDGEVITISFASTCSSTN